MPTLGVDTGGTFTDLVLVDGDEVRVEKLASTPDDPARAVLAGVESLGTTLSGLEVVHGTTVGLNALLTGRHARAALVTNAGFLDLIEIGRQERPELYALHPQKPAPLVPRELRYELGQRSWPDAEGRLEHQQQPTATELDALRAKLARSGAESIAICLLHSYADPRIEEEVARALAPLGLPITCSATLLREYREYERFSTATANAALVPVMQRYLERLRPGLGDARLSILQSSGGALPAERAALEPARVLLSGPAGGVVGAARAARAAGLERIITLDMGGTSADVAFHSARGRLEDSVATASVADLPIGLPSLDIHTIGCGGGSIVRLDPSGVLHVGPTSAGADPGPMCYGVGEELTVTDAHVLLGHVASGPFVGGRLELDHDAVARGFEALGRRLATTPADAAEAVLDVARAAMRRAIGVMTMQRGRDPRDLPLVAFGGAGGLQAAALAGALELPGALVPALPGCLSAFGMARADAISDRSLTLLEDLRACGSKRRRGLFAELTESARAELRAAGHPARAIEIERSVDLRYRGQAFELALPDGLKGDLAEGFHARHEARYGWALRDREVELVNLRARATVRCPEPSLRKPARKRFPDRAVTGERRARFGSELRCRVVDRAALAPGMELLGPALVEEFSGTTLVPPGWSARVTAGGHLWLSRA
jgi:N-methylhydantoinase A